MDTRDDNLTSHVFIGNFLCNVLPLESIEVGEERYLSEVQLSMQKKLFTPMFCKADNFPLASLDLLFTLQIRDMKGRHFN